MSIQIILLIFNLFFYMFCCIAKGFNILMPPFFFKKPSKKTTAFFCIIRLHGMENTLYLKKLVSHRRAISLFSFNFCVSFKKISINLASLY